MVQNFPSPDATDESESVPLPQLFNALAGSADHARNQLESWGVKVGPASRLEQAALSLREFATHGSIKAEPEVVTPLLRAVWVAADFIDIAAYLPQERVKSVRRELSTALSGPLWPPVDSRQPLHLQTQHWIGAVLLHAGLELDHATLPPKRKLKIPEFFVSDGTMQIGVEVKRPSSPRRIQQTVEEAIEKFTPHKCYGAIVLELTDCIQAQTEVDFKEAALALMREAHNTVWNTERGEYQPHFEKLIYLGGVVRGGWEVPTDGTPRLRLIGHALHQAYTKHPRSLQGIISARLHQRFNAAFTGVVNRLEAITMGGIH